MGAALDGAEEVIHSIGPPPAASELDPGIAPAQWDPRQQGRDELTESLGEVVTALRRLLPEGDRKYVGIAACIQRAVERIGVVLSESRTLMTGEEGCIYPRLTLELDRVRWLLISVARTRQRGDESGARQGSFANRWINGSRRLRIGRLVLNDSTLRQSFHVLRCQRVWCRTRIHFRRRSLAINGLWRLLWSNGSRVSRSLCLSTRKLSRYQLLSFVSWTTRRFR